MEDRNDGWGTLRNGEGDCARRDGDWGTLNGDRDG